MSSLFDFLYGPISSKYCVYFLYLSILYFTLFAFSTGSALISIVKKGMQVSMQHLFNVIILSGSLFLSYLQFRILYTLCIKTL